MPTQKSSEHKLTHLLNHYREDPKRLQEELAKWLQEQYGHVPLHVWMTTAALRKALASVDQVKSTLMRMLP